MENTANRPSLIIGQRLAAKLGGCFGMVLFFLPGSTPVCAAALHDPEGVFPPGEKLVYDVRWDPPTWAFFLPPVTAGELTFQVQPLSAVEGRQVRRMTVDAISSGFFLKIAGISVKDHFESLIDPKEFCSVKMTKVLREGKRQRDVYLTFDRETGSGRFMVFDASKDPRVALKDQQLQDLPHCVQDVISAIYLTRLHDLKVGAEIPLTISDDGKVKEVKLRVTIRERVETEAGKYTALRVETFSVFGGLFRQGGTLVVWVNDDARKVPVRFEARVSFGKVEGSIKRQAELWGSNPLPVRTHASVENQRMPVRVPIILLCRSISDSSPSSRSPSIGAALTAGDSFGARGPESAGCCAGYRKSQIH